MRVSVIAATLLCVIGVGVGVVGRQQNSPRVVRVTAERFSFTPSEIAVQLGEEVELRIESEDTSHGFKIVDANINAVVPKRGDGELSVLFRPERPGRYTFECSRMCGAGHDFMRGVLIVREQLARTEKPGPPGKQ